MSRDASDCPGSSAAAPKSTSTTDDNLTGSCVTNSAIVSEFATGNGSRSGSMPQHDLKSTDDTSSSQCTEEIQSELVADATSLANPRADSTGGVIPYGTRSRNRSGVSRPNYAEDRELDADFESATVACNIRKATRVTELGNASDVVKSHNFLHKIPTIDSEMISSLQSNSKDSIPGTSIFPANPNSSIGSSNIIKKRKPACHSTQQTNPILQNSHSHPKTRRSSITTKVMAGFRETNMMEFEQSQGRLNNNKLVADDGVVLEANDHVYLICEPPGEPYYLGRIMEFLHVNNDPTQPIDALRLNWYYRPKDIGRKVNDTRQVFASMHSDISPLTSLRGKCQIKHKSEVEKLDELRKSPDCFWYEKLYDRYIHRFYDVIPTSQVINVPVEVKKVLDERWKFILVELGRGKELTSAVKSCKRCNKYSASNDSVDCAVCQSTYHMSCISPPLLKKPSRGFAWACGPCSKAQEKKLEAQNTPNLLDTPIGDEEPIDEEIDLQTTIADLPETGETCLPTIGDAETSHHTGTAEQIYQASLWLFRYLGIHCKVEDALDYDDRIYPRASSRLGPRHQANVPAWHGRPVEYVKTADMKKKSVKGGSHKKDAKLSKETLIAPESEKVTRDQRPKWVMEEPSGYVHRGEDFNVSDPRCTSQLLYKLPESRDLPTSLVGDRTPGEVCEAEKQQHIFDYMGRAAGLAKHLGLPPLSTNLLDVALEILHTNNYDSEKALDALARVDRKIFKEPELNSVETKKFEDAVVKFGSEWHSIKKHVKTVTPANIVRFYYTWKKTDRGRLIWGNYVGRKGKKEAKKEKVEGNKAALKLQDDVADEHDDSAFDNDKAFRTKKCFQCKFCSTRSSRQWRRAPNTPAGQSILENTSSRSSTKDKYSHVMIALCRRCAELWRRYAIQWEDVDEIAKKLSQAGGRAGKRKIDEELLKELIAANEVINHITRSSPTIDTPDLGIQNLTTVPTLSPIEPPRKKIKVSNEKENLATTNEPLVVSKKKLTIDKPIPILPPEPPKAKIMPCAICNEIEPLADQSISCKECRLTVHRNCYGVVSDSRNSSKWTCDMCSNDKNPQVSVQYKCMLCPVESTEKDSIEHSKTVNKKRSEKDREREQAQDVADYFRNKQLEMSKPVNPREPLKRTANNNWIHVTCAVFTPEVKFGNARALEPSEGIPSIPVARYEETCKVCKKNNRGACVHCYHCRVPVHVECARQAGYNLGFDVTPIKGNRRDQFNIVNIDGEIGIMTAAIRCKDHVLSKVISHQMHHIVDNSGLNALQLFVRNFKQADLALTGTVRKATLINLSTNGNILSQLSLSTSRRTSSSVNGPSNNSRGVVTGQGTIEDTSIFRSNYIKKLCVTCLVDISPKWWPYLEETYVQLTANSPVLQLGRENQNKVLTELTKGKNCQISETSRTGNETSAALAAAALHQDEKTMPNPIISSSLELQCHQCHWKKIRKMPGHTPAVVYANMSQSSTIQLPVATIHTLKAETDLNLISRGSYLWPHTSTNIIQNGLPNSKQSPSWSHHSPTAQVISMETHANGFHTPVTKMETIHTPDPSHAQVGQKSILSSNQNGHSIQLTNGNSKHHSVTASSQNTQNSTHVLYSISRPPPPPQNLIDGGPPPLAPESPFSHPNRSDHQREHSFSSHQDSPRNHEAHTRALDPNNSQGNNIRANDSRKNGGASASPSLRNLLH